MTRPSRDEWAINLVKETAKRSTCIRRKVGCLLLNQYGEEIGTGYNGVARGMPHCNERKGDILFTIPEAEKKEILYPNACPGAFAKSGSRLDECYALHAEQNALMKCKDIHSIETCYITTSPCMTCIKMLLNTSCKRIVFYEPYSNLDAKKLWQSMGRIWEHFNQPEE